MCNKLVSIVIPTFNNAGVVGQTIESLQAQKYPNWEALFVDDGSSDSTIDIIKSYRFLDFRINIIKRDELPKGGSHCRNIGINNAKGDYLILLDSDDILTPNCIKKRVEEMNNSKYDFIVNRMVTFKDSLILGKNVGDKTIKKPLYAFAGGHAVWQITQPIYRMDFIRKLGGLDLDFLRLQDIEFELRATALSEGNFLLKLNTPEVDCYYRLSNSNITASKYLLTLEQYDKFANLVYKLREVGHLKSDCLFRKSLLCLVLSSYMVGAVPKIYDKSISIDFNNVFRTHDVKTDLHGTERIVLSFIDSLKRWPSLLYRVSWFVRRVIMFVYM